MTAFVRVGLSVHLREGCSAGSAGKLHEKSGEQALVCRAQAPVFEHSRAGGWHCCIASVDEEVAAHHTYMSLQHF